MIPTTKINDKSKRELYLFRSTASSLRNLRTTMQNLRILIIIGQPDVTSLNAISELVHLQELWVVECGITEVPGFKRNCKLEKLYLYSNEIDRVPNLTECFRLKTLSLAGNNIRELKNLSTIKSVQELNFANNKLERLSDDFSRKSELRSLNLSGNNLRCIKDIKELIALQKLNSIVFSDLLYGDCPLITFCNYRSYVINFLPAIEKVDNYSVTDGEKLQANNFYKYNWEQVTYHNMLLHKRLNTYIESVKSRYEQYQRDVSAFKDQLYAIKVEKHKESSESQNIKQLIEVTDKEFVEWKELESIELQIWQQELKIHTNHFGNISFVEYDITTQNDVIPLCQQILEESVCSVLKNKGITGVTLHKVTKVVNKGIDCSDFEESEKCGPELNTNNTIFKVLVSPEGVRNINEWPLKFCETELFSQKEIMVSDCLAAADTKWLNEMFSIRNNINLFDTLGTCQKRRICVLVQTPVATPAENSGKTCQEFKLTNREIRNPIFVIEYEYAVQESMNINFRRNKSSRCTVKSKLNKIPSECISNVNISRYVGMEEQQIHNLVKMCITGHDINSIDSELDLPNLREFDVSYNRLTEFPNCKFMKNIKILNVSFNNIKSLSAMETLPILQVLNISWNSLTSCVTCCQAFDTFLPDLYALNIEKNPFEDVTDIKMIERLLLNYLPKLNFIDDISSKSCTTLPKSYLPCVLDTCKENKRQQEELVNLNAESISDRKKIERMKYIHVSQNALCASTILQNILKIQELCITSCLLNTVSITRPLKYLTKLNLSSNLILTMEGLTQENLPGLKHLDLTDNLIKSLECMKSFSTLQEFYCGHNNITSLSEIENIKTWHMLQIVDFSNNPISGDPLHRQFLVFHLASVKYISGKRVEEPDVKEARHVFGNTLDKSILCLTHKADQLTSITQLSVVNCSLKKVDLRSDCLPHLESLDLSKNRITFLWGLHTFKHLHTLCLSHNCLKKFYEEEVRNVSSPFLKLCTLFLDHNCISSLVNIGKGKMPVLRHIFLNHNRLETIEGINQCSTLETLILDNNRIEVLSDDFHRSSIKFLSVENNRIKSLNFIKSLPKLEKFYAANNCIKTESELHCLSMLTKLEELTLDGNPVFTEISDGKIIIKDFELKNFET